MQTTILIGLFICHFLADYKLTTARMLDAKRLGKPLIFILAHAMVYTLLMGAYLVWLGIKNTIILMVFQLITHLLIDVLKGRMNVWFPSLQSPANKWHWIVFGFDKLLHAVVITVILLDGA
jgi:hypothetical protein